MTNTVVGSFARQWSRIGTGFDCSGTGPNPGNYRGNPRGTFAFLEASGFHNRVARLRSPIRLGSTANWAGRIVVTFNYFMYGVGTGTLEVKTEDSGRDPDTVRRESCGRPRGGGTHRSPEAHAIH